VLDVGTGNGQFLLAMRALGWSCYGVETSPVAAQHARMVLALHVPNWDSIERRLFRERWIAIDAPRHLYHFDARTLRLLLEQAGFEVRQLEACAPVLSLASNVLRWGGDRLRGGRPKPSRSTGPNPPGVSSSRQLLIPVVHQLMRLPNALANSLAEGPL
jgi:SAM-dependent methyltransferase